MNAERQIVRASEQGFRRLVNEDWIDLGSMYIAVDLLYLKPCSLKRDKVPVA